MRITESQLRFIIRNIIKENEDHEENIIDDFLSSNMYKQVAHLFESLRFSVFEAKSPRKIKLDKEQIDVIHTSLKKYTKEIRPDIELNEKIEALAELRRAKENKEFHQRKANINKFRKKLGIALEAVPFLFLLVYLFNTNNPELKQWCLENDITLTASFVTFMMSFLFGKAIRAGQKQKYTQNKDAAEFYRERESELKKHI